MKRLKQKDLYRFISKFLIPHSSFLIARQREKWQFVGLWDGVLKFVNCIIFCLWYNEGK